MKFSRSNIPYGKRLVSDKAKTMWGRFVGNEDFTDTLSAGEPSPIVQGFAANNTDPSDSSLYFRLKDPNQDDARFIKASDDLKVVGKDAEDKSSWLSQVGHFLYDDFQNTMAGNKQYLSQLGEGFDKATADIAKDFSFLSPGSLKTGIKLLIGLIGVMIAWKIVQFLQN